MDGRAALAVGRAWHGLLSAQGVLPRGCLWATGWRKQAPQPLLQGQG